MIEIRRSFVFPEGFDNQVEEFIYKSGEKERTVESIKNQIGDILNRGTGGLWTIWNDERLSGYLFADIVPAEYGGFVCLIHNLMIDRNRKNILKNVNDIIEPWAKKNGASEMAFFTRRNTKAMIRALNNDWEIDSTVLKRKIK